MPQDSDGVEVKGPMGTSARFKGAASSSALLLFLLAAIFLWIARNGESRADDRNAEIRASLQQVREALVRNDETQQALIYVLALPQEERAILLRNMKKPRMLRDMSRDGER